STRSAGNAGAPPGARKSAAAFAGRSTWFVSAASQRMFRTAPQWKSPLRFRTSHANLVKHLPQHDVVIEIFAGQVTRGAAMAHIVRIDRLHGGQDFVHVREGE